MVEERPVDVTLEIEKALEVIKITGLDARVENPIAQQAAPIQIENIASTNRVQLAILMKKRVLELSMLLVKARMDLARLAGKKLQRKKPRKPSPNRAKDTLGVMYYKTYDESRANESHAPVWNLKQSDTLTEFDTCMEWMMGTFP
ncbi:hypothetical protein Hanom_Chr12g01158811 [Helianthus anomalus]